MKKLLIVLGAGASIEFGMPSVYEIDKLFERRASDNYSLKNKEESKNLYTWLKEKILNHRKENAKIGIKYELNFETLLFTMQNISSISNEENIDYNKSLKAFIKLNQFPEIITRYREEKRADGNDFKDMQASLTDQLLIHIRRKCLTLNKDKRDELNKAKQFFNDLKEEYDLGFINLNYDNVILNILPDLSTGFNLEDGKFDKTEFYSNKWNFCYHLHGSIHFNMTNDGPQSHNIIWENDLNNNFQTRSTNRNVNYTSEGNYHLNSTIISGLDKANQLLRAPYRQYYMKIDSLVNESDAILFIGYGFNDMHLNKVFPSHRFSPNKKRNVVVIDYATEDTNSIQMHSNRDWTHRLFETIPYNFYDFGISKYLPKDETILYYKKNSTFESSRNEKYPVSVWYNGFLEACENSEKFKKELN
ncbi:MAG: hypothetical protein CMC14_04105 [Flavobacteriaceae bacterium]|nr:hypothetical protein [Flavobacteriaceae bacterium]|tara:strand:- start:231759 stop:233012 length:1254 start_codon:yes stop_codon:yes gene_type:complete